MNPFVDPRPGILDPRFCARNRLCFQFVLVPDLANDIVDDTGGFSGFKLKAWSQASSRRLIEGIGSAGKSVAGILPTHPRPRGSSK